MKKLKTKLIYTKKTPRGSGKTFFQTIYFIKKYLKNKLGIKWYFISKKNKNKLITDTYKQLSGAY